MIELEHVSKTYRTGPVKLRALDDITLTIADGEMVASWARPDPASRP